MKMYINFNTHIHHCLQQNVFSILYKNVPTNSTKYQRNSKIGNSFKSS